MAPRIPKDRFYFPTVALVFFIAFILSGLSIFSTLKNKNIYLNETIIKSRAQAQLLGENASSLIYNVDLTLLSIQAMLRNQNMNNGSFPVSIENFMKSQIKFLPQVNNIVILNSKKEVYYSYKKLQNFEFKSFEEHRDAWTDFSIGIAFTDDKDVKIIASRRLEKQDAEFDGVLAAIVDPNVFYNQYGDYLNIDVDAIALFDMQGGIITSWFKSPGSAQQFTGSNIQTIPLFSALKQNIASGGGRRTHEDVETIVSTFQLSGFPFQIAVSYSKKNVLQKWQREATFNIIIIGVTILLLILTIALSFHQRKRRKQAEREIVQYQNHLEETVEKRTQELSETNKELHKTNDDLNKALLEVKTLSGMLPICSYCKKIRDDKGYWNQLESYIHEHSDAQFSHGICPECAQKYYPEIYNREKTG
ncbi:MAG: PDC sensor domain-containing protein [Syntrophales bacterium]